MDQTNRLDIHTITFVFRYWAMDRVSLIHGCGRQSFEPQSRRQLTGTPDQVGYRLKRRFRRENCAHAAIVAFPGDQTEQLSFHPFGQKVPKFVHGDGVCKGERPNDMESTGESDPFAGIWRCCPIAWGLICGPYTRLT